MTKAELITMIAQQTGYHKDKVVAIVNCLTHTVKAQIANGETIYLRGFGNFYKKHQRQRKARIVKKGIEIVIEAKDIPAFKPSKEFVKQVKTAQEPC